MVYYIDFGPLFGLLPTTTHVRSPFSLYLVYLYHILFYYTFRLLHTYITNLLLLLTDLIHFCFYSFSLMHFSTRFREMEWKDSSGSLVGTLRGSHPSALLRLSFLSCLLFARTCLWLCSLTFLQFAFYLLFLPCLHECLPAFCLRDIVGPGGLGRRDRLDYWAGTFSFLLPTYLCSLFVFSAFPAHTCL